ESSKGVESVRRLTPRLSKTQGVPPSRLLKTKSILSMSSVYVCPHCKTRIPLGTVTKPPPGRCPDCRRRLRIPTSLPTDAFADVTCPHCSTTFTPFWYELPSGTRRDRFACPKCGSVVAPPDA